MSTTTTDRPDVEAYLAAVRAELADLRPDERDEVLLDVEASIVDAAGESDAPIAVRLGPPGEFAAELRAAAGLAPAESGPPTLRLRELWGSPQVATARGALVELAPIWWVARAYAALWILAWVVRADQTSSVPAVGRLFGDAEVALFFLALAAAASVALGLWSRRRGSTARIGLIVNVVLALAAMPAFAGLAEWLSGGIAGTTYVVETSAPPGLTRDGVPVENVYPYSRNGRLLLDVMLYDQNGAPIEVRGLDVDPNRRLLQRRDGGQLFNSFPIRYFEPGTRRVARPGASPPIDWLPIATPPLERGAARTP